MDIINTVSLVIVTYLVLITVLARILLLPAPISMLLSITSAIILIVKNRKRIDKWMQPSSRNRKRHPTPPRNANRAIRRSKYYR